MNDININNVLARENLAKNLLTLRLSQNKNKEEIYSILQDLKNSEYYSSIKSGKIVDKNLREDIKKMGHIETDIIIGVKKMRMPTAIKRLDKLKLRGFIKKDTKLNPPFVTVVCRRFDIEKKCMYSTIVKEIDFKSSKQGLIMGVGPELAIETLCINIDGSYYRLDYKHTLDMKVMDIWINEKMQSNENISREGQIGSIYLEDVLN